MFDMRRTTPCTTVVHKLRTGLPEKALAMALQAVHLEVKMPLADLNACDCPPEHTLIEFGVGSSRYLTSRHGMLSAQHAHMRHDIHSMPLALANPGAHANSMLYAALYSFNAPPHGCRHARAPHAQAHARSAAHAQTARHMQRSKLSYTSKLIMQHGVVNMHAYQTIEDRKHTRSVLPSWYARTKTQNLQARDAISSLHGP